MRNAFWHSYMIAFLFDAPLLLHSDKTQIVTAHHMDINSCDLGFSKQDPDASQMMRLETLAVEKNIWTKFANGTTDFPLHVRTPISPTPHRASGSKLRFHGLMCGIVPSFWHGILSLLGCQHFLPPPSAMASAMLHPRRHPLFVTEIQLGRQTMPMSWHQILEGAAKKKTNLSLFPPLFCWSTGTSASL